MKVLRNTPLLFDAGVLAGVALAVIVQIGVLIAWALWIIRNTY